MAEEFTYGQDSQIRTRWWCGYAPDRDVFNIFVVRYHKAEQIGADPKELWAPWSERLTYEGDWRVYTDGEIIEPTLSLNGRLCHALLTVGALESRPVELALIDLITKYLRATLEPDTEEEETALATPPEG